MLTAEYVHDQYIYEPETGLLKKRYSSRGYPAGYQLGHTATNIKGKHYRIVDIIWLHYYGVWPSKIIDHKDRDRTNTKIDNLREATYSQNGANRTWHNANGKGVTYHHDRVTKPWQAQIRIAGRKTNLGRYATKEEAAAVYAKAALEHHGEFACLI